MAEPVPQPVRPAFRAVAEMVAPKARPRAGRPPAVVDVEIGSSVKTYFTTGVVKTNVRRLPWPDRLRFIGRAIGRNVFS